MKMNQRTRLVPSTTNVTFQTTSNKCIQLKHKQPSTSSTRRQSFQRLHRTMKQQSKRRQTRINQRVPYNTNTFICSSAAHPFQRRPTSITSTTTTCASLHSHSSLTSASNYPASTTSLFSLPDSASSWNEYGTMAGMSYNMSEMADETDVEEDADQPLQPQGEMTCSANF